MNEKLVSLWDGIADAIRYQHMSDDSMYPSSYPDLIDGMTLPDEGKYPIYVSGPSNSTVTATSMGGGVSTQAYLMRMVTG